MGGKHVLVCFKLGIKLNEYIIKQLLNSAFNYHLMNFAGQGQGNDNQLHSIIIDN